MRHYLISRLVRVSWTALLAGVPALAGAQMPDDGAMPPAGPQTAAEVFAQADDGVTSTATGTAKARFGLEFEPVNFDPPEVNHAELGNGMTLDHYREAAPPLVTVLVRIGVGSIHDPRDKVGLANMTAQVIRNGGSVDLPGDDLDRELESRGAELSASADREETWFRLSVLREDLEWGMGVLTDLLTKPALPEEKLEEARGPQLFGLQQRLDVPGDVARALFPQLVFGKGNPWGWTETTETLTAISIADTRSLFEKFYTSGNMKLGISGAVEWDEARAASENSLGSIARKPAPQAPLPQVEAVDQMRVYVVPREATQNVVYFGHEGIDRFDQRKWAVRVFNNVLAGGFTSRLFNQVRTQRGLAYAVYGRIGEGTNKGLYVNVALTKVATTQEALDAMLHINQDLKRDPPTQAELELARQSDINSFVFFFDSAEKIVRQKMTLDAYGYPPEYLATYVNHVAAVGGEQVRDAANEILHLNDLVVLVVGEVNDELRAELEKMGEITEISEGELRAEWL